MVIWQTKRQSNCTKFQLLAWMTMISRTWMGKSAALGKYVRSSKTRVISAVYVDDIKNGWKETECGSHVEEIDERRWSWSTNIISWPWKFWDVLNVNAKLMKQLLNDMQRCLNHVCLLEQRKNYRGGKIHTQKTVAWSCDVEGHARECGERYCELANKKVEQLYKVSNPCLDDHQFKREDLESVGEFSEVCSQIVLKCLHFARSGRPDILWLVNQLARSVAKMDSGMRQTTSKIDFCIHSSHKRIRRYCHVGNTAQHCRLGSFRDSDFAGDLQDSKSTSGGVLCILGSRTFVPVSWMCKKQMSVSLSSTESEIISLDAGLRMDGLLALEPWKFIIEVLRSTNNTVKPKPW